MFSPLYLDGSDLLGNDRVERTVKYVNYYRNLKRELNFDSFVFYDNASDINRIDDFKYKINANEHHDVDVFSNRIHLPRTGILGYPYCWRALWALRPMMLSGAIRKILLFDTDCFVVSSRLGEFIRECNSGWVTVMCERYQFPEAAFQIINLDSFPMFLTFTDRPWGQFVGRVMETELPYNVLTNFNCDRYGESREAQRPEMDLYAQAPVDIPLSYNGQRRRDLNAK